MIADPWRGTPVVYAETRALCQQQLGASVPESMVDELFYNTSGHPIYVIEILSHLRQVQQQHVWNPMKVFDTQEHLHQLTRAGNNVTNRLNLTSMITARIDRLIPTEQLTLKVGHLSHCCGRRWVTAMLARWLCCQTNATTSRQSFLLTILSLHLMPFLVDIWTKTNALYRFMWSQYSEWFDNDMVSPHLCWRCASNAVEIWLFIGGYCKAQFLVWFHTSYISSAHITHNCFMGWSTSLPCWDFLPVACLKPASQKARHALFYCRVCQLIVIQLSF